MEALIMARDRRGVKSIFDEAAEMASIEVRAAYLERACGGDAEIRQQVEGLLRALDAAGSFLEAPPDLDEPRDRDADTFRIEPGVPPGRTSAIEFRRCLSILVSSRKAFSTMCPVHGCVELFFCQ